MVVTDEILSKEQLMKFSKDEIVEYHMRSSNLANTIAELSKTLRTVSDRLTKAESELSLSRNANVHLQDHCERLERRVIEVEKTSTNNSQYLRRRQIEVRNYKANLSNDDQLKDKIAAVLSLTGTPIKATDLDKCHLLKNKAVIMEFKERELRDAVLRGRKNLKNKSDALADLQMDRVMITESLCREYAKMDYVCRMLKKNGRVKQTWFWNGRLHVGFDDNTQNEIRHSADLYGLFGNTVIDAIFEASKKGK